MSTLETRIAEVVSEHRAGATNSVQTCCMCDSTWRTHADHDAHATAVLAPVIRKAKAEALREAADEFPGHIPGRMSTGYWLRARADKLVTE